MKEGGYKTQRVFYKPNELDGDTLGFWIKKIKVLPE